MTLGIDAGVILKWLLQQPDDGPCTDRAVAVIESIIASREDIIQPTQACGSGEGARTIIADHSGARCAKIGIA